MEILEQLFTDYTLRTVALGSAVLGIVSGALGSFAVLRQQSLLGDAISHAALPGIGLAYLLTGSKAPLVLMAGAGMAGGLASIMVLAVTRNTRIKFDTALGIALSVFFGFGLVILTYLQKQPDANQAGLANFLFGQAAALVTRDVTVMAIVGAIALLVVFLFWKEFKLSTFDGEYGASIGYPVRYLEGLLTLLFVVAIVIGLQTVGVVLMSALLIAPAAAARQWTNRLSLMVILAALFGGVSGVTGAMWSSTARSLPTGPLIVLVAGGIVTVSFLLAPSRGLVWSGIRDWRNGRKLRMEAVLLDLYALAAQHDRSDYPHAQAVLDLMAHPIRGTSRSLEALSERGLARQIGPSLWALTAAGVARAENIVEDRIGVAG